MSRAARVDEALVAGPVSARRLGEGDLADLLAMHADPVVMAALGGTRDRATTERYLADNVDHWERHGFGLYALRELGGGFVGRAGLRRLRLDGRDEIEVAYALRAEYWGRGLALAVCERLIELAARARLGESLVAITLPAHRRSWRVMEKAGFGFEREVQYGGSPHVLYRRRLGAAVARNTV